MDLAVIALTFAAIFAVELPDKTFIAALVLSTRYRALLVWVGVGLAFLLQVLIAVTAGRLATLLPQTPVRIGAAAVFVIGAVLLVRSAPGADEPGSGSGPSRRPSSCSSRPSGETSRSCSPPAWWRSTTSR
jgi:hypothetical protein